MGPLLVRHPGRVAVAGALTIAFSAILVRKAGLSLPRLPAAVTSVLLTVQPVGSVILGVILLSESPSLLQLAGVAFIFSGVIVATARRSRVPA